VSAPPSGLASAPRSGPASAPTSDLPGLRVGDESRDLEVRCALESEERWPLRPQALNAASEPAGSCLIRYTVRRVSLASLVICAMPTVWFPSTLVVDVMEAPKRPHHFGSVLTGHLFKIPIANLWAPVFSSDTIARGLSLLDDWGATK
jgi:hypothetical protein